MGSARDKMRTRHPEHNRQVNNDFWRSVWDDPLWERLRDSRAGNA